MPDFFEGAHKLRGFLAELRQALHREPEVGLMLPLTQQKVLRALEGLPLEITTGNNTSSVTAVLRGTADGGNVGDSRPAVLIRGDMDALPVTESTGLPFSSALKGTMHACGHDLHTTMLVGAAHLLCRHQDHLSGDVIFMFQPGEESWNGAGVMIDEGVLEAAGPMPAAALALHVFTGIGERGTFFTKPGPMMAASDQLHVTVRGTGGHGSMPHLARDPVTAAAEMVTALQTMVTRRFDIFDPVVISVGLLRAGTKANVIPSEAHFQATVRTFSRTARESVQQLAVSTLQGISEAHGVDSTITWVPGYPVTVNDPGEIDFVIESIRGLFGEDRATVVEHPLAGAEDFSRVLERVPGTFIGLGATPLDQEGEEVPFNHSPEARFDDSVMVDGAALYAAWAAQRLSAASRSLQHQVTTHA